LAFHKGETLENEFVTSLIPTVAAQIPSLMDIGDHIGEVGAVIFVLGVTALVAAVLLIKAGYQKIETSSPLHPATAIALQVIGGAMGWVMLNSLVYVGFQFIDRICVDKDDIACGMVVLIVLFFAAVLINLGAAIGILILLLRQKRGVAAGALLAFGITAMMIGSFLLAQLRFE